MRPGMGGGGFPGGGMRGGNFQGGGQGFFRSGCSARASRKNSGADNLSISIQDDRVGAGRSTVHPSDVACIAITSCHDSLFHSQRFRECFDSRSQLPAALGRAICFDFQQRLIRVLLQFPVLKPVIIAELDRVTDDTSGCGICPVLPELHPHAGILLIQQSTGVIKAQGIQICRSRRGKGSASGTGSVYDGQ